VAAPAQRDLFLTGPVLSNGVYIFSGKIKLPVVEQIMRDAIEYDPYSTGEEIIKMLEPDFL
jgi:hypothetical protein